MLGLLMACLPPPPSVGQVATGTTATETSTDATVTTSLAASTSTTSTTTITDTTASSTANDLTTEDPGATFIAETDSDGSITECNVYAQDCPLGQKCAWTGSEDAQWWDTPTCVPLVRDPLPDGAPCTYHLDPLFDGIDECGPAAMCVEGYFESGEWDGQATCMSMCKGSFEHPYCEIGAVCVGTRSLWLCMPTCDPFAQDCPVGQRCDLYGPATLCTWDQPDEPRVEVGEPCNYPEECELGATCISAATPACAETSCCTPFCDLSDPQAVCPLPGQQCLPPYDWVQPGEESLGVCRTEGP